MKFAIVATLSAVARACSCTCRCATRRAAEEEGFEAAVVEQVAVDFKVVAAAGDSLVEEGRGAAAVKAVVEVVAPTQPAPGYRAAGPAPHGAMSNHGFVYGHRPAYHGGWYHGDWHGNWGHPFGYRPWGWYWGGGWGWGFGWGLGTGLAPGCVAGFSVGMGLLPLLESLLGAARRRRRVHQLRSTDRRGTAGRSTECCAAICAQVPPSPAPGGLDGAFTPPPALPPGASAAAGSTVTTAQQQALAVFDIARELFKKGDYQLALAETNRAIALAPNDTLMHEFRALCLFASKDYQQSAAAIYAVLSIGPGWDWATVAGLYPDPSLYTQQLRALEGYCNENPQAPHARFLLAYHYLLEGHNDEAAIEFEAVVELQPKDQLSAQLLKGLKNPPSDQAPAEPELAAPALPTTPVEPAMVLGSWKSSRADGSKFELSLTKDNKFSWKFSQDGKDQQLKGTYTLANNYLILSANNQNALVGQVAMQPGDKLQFKLAGGAAERPGIDVHTLAAGLSTLSSRLCNMKILFLHGWQSTPGGLKPTYLAAGGHEVLNPALPDEDFAAAIRIAEREIELHQPAVIVGSSRGGAVAMNVCADGIPLVLLCPAWKRWGTACSVQPGTVILHSRADDVIPFADSQELVAHSGLAESALIEIGNDHRLADPASLAAMLAAAEWAVRCNPASD